MLQGVSVTVNGSASRPRCALGVVIITFYTFGENLEILSYLFWRSLVGGGVTMRRRVYNPSRRRFESLQAGRPEGAQLAHGLSL